MQCANCQFENMPSTRLCARCGASLQLALATLNVQPPRARQWSKTLRQWLPMRRVYHASRDAVATVPARSILAELIRPVEIDEVTPGILVRMIAPGWAQAYFGNRLRGALFSLLYWPCMLYAIVAMGSTDGALAIGIAFAIHAASLIDVLTSSEDGLLRRVCVVPIVVAISLAAFYWGLGTVASQIASPRQLVRGVPPFSEGDVVLINRRTFAFSPPQPGDVVLFHVPSRPEGFRVQGIGRQPTFMRIAGERIDRVIAGPGSTVRWDGERVWVNDQPSEIRPLNQQHLPPSLTIRVPDEHYAILLTTDGLLNATTPLAVWQFVCSVPADHIVGRAFLRNYPLSRWWWIR